MKLIRSILSILAAVLVLMASSSFYVGVHTCGGTVKAVAFMQEADGCGHQALPPCHRALMKGCCEDDAIVHEAQGFKDSCTTITLAVSPSVDIEQLPVLLAEVIPSSALVKNEYHNYDPPLRSTDRTIDLQVFLI